MRKANSAQGENGARRTVRKANCAQNADTTSSPTIELGATPEKRSTTSILGLLQGLSALRVIPYLITARVLTTTAAEDCPSPRCFWVCADYHPCNLGLLLFERPTDSITSSLLAVFVVFCPK
eukprot:IDg8983t1